MTEQHEGVAVWSLPDDEIIALAGRIRAGRDLSPGAWPSGKRVAVLCSIDVDNETAFMEDGDVPSYLQSRLEYGGRRGLQRLVELFDQHEVPVTFFVPAMSLKISPHMAEDIKRSGNHEVALHGWVHESAAFLSEEQHRMLLTRSIEYLESVFGVRPVGYRTPWGVAGDAMAPHTLPLLKELGILYDSSLCSDDRPYELHLDGEPYGLIEIPPSENTLDTLMAMNPMDTGGISHPPQNVFDMFKDEFDLAYREGTVFHALLHPHISGQRAQVAALGRFIDYVASKDVWFATHRQVAELVSHGLNAE